MTSELLAHRLVVVTGKGGVGKTTVAAALGTAAAAQGARALVAEVGGQTRLPVIFGRSPGGVGEEVELGGGLWATTIDPVHALGEWLGTQLPGRLSSVLTRSGTFGAFVAAAPGSAELVGTVKAWELGSGRRWRKERRPFDVVVLDAPASGHGVGMLRAPRTYADIARVGPIASQARTVVQALADEAHTAYVAVALPTELAVTETLELEHRLQEGVGRSFAAIVCNGMLPRRVGHGDLEALAAHDGAVPGVALRAAHAGEGRVRAQHAQLERLRRHAGAHVATLPFRFVTQLGLDDVRDLGRKLVHGLEHG